MRAVDRPPFQAVLPLEVGQVIELVLGGLDLGHRPLAESGSGGDQLADHREVLLDVAGDVQLAAGSQRALDWATRASVKTRRFLCRFFHHGSGK